MTTGLLGKLHQRGLKQLTALTARGSFGRSVGILVGGTMMGRAIPILALPLLTRLYSPADFSVLAVYTGVLTIMAAVACLRFEIAIPIPEDEADAANLLALALISTSVIALACGVAVLAFPDAIIAALDAPSLRPHLWLLPVGVAAVGFYNATQYWSTRHKRFRAVATTRLSQAGVGTAVSLGMGVAGMAPLGLLLGNMLTTGAGFVGLGLGAVRRDWAALRRVRPSKMLQAVQDYRRFPTYSTFDALANNAGMQVPIILIAALAVGPEAGFLMLAMQVMRLPISLMGASIAQVYLSRAGQEDRDGNLAPFTTKVVRGLIQIGVGPLIFIGLASPGLFGLAFGEEWRRAGELVIWMTPWFILQFISSPISMVMHVRGRQGLLLVLTVFGGVMRVAGVALAAPYAGGALSEVYAATSAVFYMAVCAICFRVAGVKVSTLVRLRREAPLLVSGLVLGLAALWLLG